MKPRDNGWDWIDNTPNVLGVAMLLTFYGLFWSMVGVLVGWVLWSQ